MRLVAPSLLPLHCKRIHFFLQCGQLLNGLLRVTHGGSFKFEIK